MLYVNLRSCFYEVRSYITMLSQPSSNHVRASSQLPVAFNQPEQSPLFIRPINNPPHAPFIIQRVRAGAASARPVPVGACLPVRYPPPILSIPPPPSNPLNPRPETAHTPPAFCVSHGPRSDWPRFPPYAVITTNTIPPRPAPPRRVPSGAARCCDGTRASWD